MKEFRHPTYHYFCDDNKQIQGEYKSWYLNGKLSSHCFFIDNLLNGPFKRYYESTGHLAQECNYINGNIEGEMFVYWESGELQKHCHVKNTQYHGEFKEYTRSGELIEHCFYISGQRISFKDIPFPKCEIDRMYFILKYDLPLLPVEATC